MQKPQEGPHPIKETRTMFENTREKAQLLHVNLERFPDVENDKEVLVQGVFIKEVKYLAMKVLREVDIALIDMKKFDAQYDRMVEPVRISEAEKTELKKELETLSTKSSKKTPSCPRKARKTQI